MEITGTRILIFLNPKRKKIKSKDKSGREYPMLRIFPVLIINIDPLLMLHDAHFNLHTVEINLITKMLVKY